MPEIHPLVQQLRFTRSEFRRGLEGLSNEDAQQRIKAMNSIGWMIGHLAWQEQRYWVYRAQGILLLPVLNERFAYGAAATVPTLDEAWIAWNTIISAADPWLDTLDTLKMQKPLAKGFSNIGTFLHRTTYHYWYHLGEAMAVRQALGHTDLPDFVGDIDSEAPYIAE